MKNKMRSLFYLIAIIIFVSCSDSATKHQKLPFIGKHDIASVDSEGIKKGDTVYHTVPPFSLLTQDSLPFTNATIAGKIWVAKFFFTKCPTICPPMTHAMKEVYDTVATFSEDVVFLSFSIDPTKDSPKKLTEYIQSHSLTTKNWYFLTGADEDDMHELGIEGFYIHAQADEYAKGGYAHSPNFVLVDQNQHIRGIYDGLVLEDRNKLISDIKILLADGN